MHDSPGYLRFLTRARRRWSVWRCLELGGVCAAMGAAIALLLMPVLVVRGSNSFEPSLLLMIFGAVAGLVLGITRRPTLSQTALRADQQLGLHDLLSTALSLSKWSDPAVASVILTQADAVCMRRSPSEIVVARLSGRAWGGIAVVGGLTLTLAMLLQGSPATLADGLDEVGIVRATPATADIARSESRAAEHIQSVANRPVESDRSAGLSSPDAKSAISDDGRDTPRSRADGGSSTAGSDTQSADVAGSQEATTNDARVASLAQGLSSDLTDRLAGGTLSVGGSAVPAAASEQTSSSAASRDSRSGATSEMASPRWNLSGASSRTQAESEIRSGKVPDAFRDVVQEYFSNRSR